MIQTRAQRIPPAAQNRLISAPGSILVKTSVMGDCSVLSGHSATVNAISKPLSNYSAGAGDYCELVTAQWDAAGNRPSRRPNVFGREGTYSHPATRWR